MSQLKQHRIAVETREIYAPLAHRLGMSSVKAQLDDLVLKTLNPTVFKEIDSKGHFESDDEVGTIFSALKDVSQVLNEVLEEEDQNG